ncbi:helix-turn-helix DNA binding domain protein [Mycobacterium phage Funsized]|nr:helix-turn-helix DNA binding domain protein [Mycobacterium phage Funsized]
MTTPETHTHGLAEVVRALRLFIGLSQRDAARRFDMDRRDYQRIESGRDACPPGMVSTLEEWADRFAHEVEMVLDLAERRDPADGPLHLLVVPDGTSEEEWDRLVAGRAFVETTADHPIVLAEAANEKPVKVG